MGKTLGLYLDDYLKLVQKILQFAFLFAVYIIKEKLDKELGPEGPVAFTK